MMIVSEGCIQHPSTNPSLVIRKWQLDACDGDQVAAALLSFFEDQHNAKLESSTDPKDLIQPFNGQELRKGILGFSNETAISRSLKRLETLGFIEICKNPKPDPHALFDKRRYFLFKPEVIIEYLQNRTNIAKTP
jgi:hypothetical protein